MPPPERMSELAVLMKLALSHSIDTCARASLSQQAKKKALKERSLVEELTWKQQVTCLPGSNWHAGLYDASPRRPDCPHGSPAGGKALL